MRRPLLLIPTLFERNTLEVLLAPTIQQTGGTLHLCGFGPVAAAARTSQLIAKFQPEHVVLVGIAGAIGERLAVGSACSFDEVVCYGIGVGSGESFQTAGSLGWPQWQPEEDTVRGPTTCVNDTLPLSNEESGPGSERQPGGKQESEPMQLLTCCAASDSQSDVANKRRWFPDAIAEDMEGFAVAMACSLAQVPLTIIRGISNRAGDRDKSRWQVEKALAAASEKVIQLIADGSPPS
ncbi:MAG: futalosine hydrolase [Rhodopirellula sp.]|nr:futalosine hydrolase [Rhodopirellula sp.]